MSPQTVTTRERFSSPLTWHWIAFGLMILVVVVLATRVALDWAATDTGSSDALAAKQVELKTLEVQTSPLRGLDQRVVDSRKQIQDFYATRIPANYSSIAIEIGNLQMKSGVMISGVQYSQGATSGNLTEISLDARISGEYQQIMRFVNGIERDKIFFIIRSTTFTGQQGGLVNLRMRLSTWLRPADVPSGLPATQPETPGTEPPAQEGI